MKIAIIDDEEYCIGALESLLAELNYNIEIVGTAQTVKAGIELLQNQDFDLLFLDIKLRGGNGFDILEQIQKDNFGLVFTTAYSEYAMKAFEYAAIHYLLKPIDEEDLTKAIDRFITQSKHKNQSPTINKQVNLAKQMLHTGNTNLLVINSTEETLFLDLNNILYFEAQSNYTLIYQEKKAAIICSKTLKTYEDLLQEQDFFRIHSKYVINLKQVSQFHKGKSNQVQLVDGTMLDVSKRRKKDFLENFKDSRK